MYANELAAIYIYKMQKINGLIAQIVNFSSDNHISSVCILVSHLEGTICVCVCVNSSIKYIARLRIISFEKFAYLITTVLFVLQHVKICAPFRWRAAAAAVAASSYVIKLFVNLNFVFCLIISLLCNVKRQAFTHIVYNALQLAKL